MPAVLSSNFVGPTASQQSATATGNLSSAAQNLGQVVAQANAQKEANRAAWMTSYYDKWLAPALKNMPIQEYASTPQGKQTLAVYFMVQNGLDPRAVNNQNAWGSYLPAAQKQIDDLQKSPMSAEAVQQTAQNQYASGKVSQNQGQTPNTSAPQVSAGAGSSTPIVSQRPTTQAPNATYGTAALAGGDKTSPSVKPNQAQAAAIVQALINTAASGKQSYQNAGTPGIVSPAPTNLQMAPGAIPGATTFGAAAPTIAQTATPVTPAQGTQPSAPALTPAAAPTSMEQATPVQKEAFIRYLNANPQLGKTTKLPDNPNPQAVARQFDAIKASGNQATWNRWASGTSTAAPAAPSTPVPTTGMNANDASAVQRLQAARATIGQDSTVDRRTEIDGTRAIDKTLQSNSRRANLLWRANSNLQTAPEKDIANVAAQYLNQIAPGSAASDNPALGSMFINKAKTDERLANAQIELTAAQAGYTKEQTALMKDDLAIRLAAANAQSMSATSTEYKTVLEQSVAMFKVKWEQAMLKNPDATMSDASFKADETRIYEMMAQGLGNTVVTKGTSNIKGFKNPKTLWDMILGFGNTPSTESTYGFQPANSVAPGMSAGANTMPSRPQAPVTSGNSTAAKGSTANAASVAAQFGLTY